MCARGHSRIEHRAIFRRIGGDDRGGGHDPQAHPLHTARIGVARVADGDFRVRRVDSGTGKILWNHVQERHPLDVRIDQNTFQLLFRKEVQLLKYIAL